MDKGQYTSVSFIELKKTFNSVDHQMLLNKLRIVDYRAKRKPGLSRFGQTSNLQPIKLGAPQGSCLGPLLFLIYINELPQKLNASTASMHADDTSISLSSNSISTIKKCC